MDFRNATALDSERLLALFHRHTAPYRHDALTVRMRYSRGADFSGTCYYRDARIFINLGRHTRFPYRLATNLARARSRGWYWSRAAYYVTARDAYELALFVYLHELFHYLVKAAGRSPRRKEAMCDRFAAAALVDHHGAAVCDAAGRTVARELWDFRDLRAFVAAAPRIATPTAARPRPIPVRVRGLPATAARHPAAGGT
jgi:hypothetical protein